MKIGILKTIKPLLSKYEPEILMGMGISGMIFSTVWAIKATKKATRILDNKKVELNKEKLSAKEIFVEVWRLYLPVVVSSVISVPCIIAGNRVSNKRTAAIAAAYTLSETALQTYQDKTRELVGEKKEKDIHEAASKENVGKTYSGSNVILTGDGDSLFFEPLSGRYFKSSWNKILKAANELNAEAVSGIFGEITLTDWFSKLGLNKTEVSGTTGWTLKDGVKGLIEIQIDSSLTPDDIPCGSIYYKNRPKPLN